MQAISLPKGDTLSYGQGLSGHQWGGVFGDSAFPDKGKYTLPYEQGDDAVYPPREVSAKEEHV